MASTQNYLKNELYDLIQKDPSVFDFLQQGALDGVWYWDLEKLENEWMSPRFWEVLGYDPGEKDHLSSEWQDIIFKEDFDLAIQNFTRHCEDPSHPYDQIVRYRHKNGSVVWVRCRGIAIRDESGKPVRMLGAHSEITQQKLAEEELEKRNKELEETNQRLEKALAEIKSLKGILPFCSYCKTIRNDAGYWEMVDVYIQKHSAADISHSICPTCAKKHFPEEYKAILQSDVKS
ncbi:MAG: PAS domain-containing protein [Thermodesulfobacteriota bacterium]